MTILCRYSLFYYSHSPQFFHLFHVQKIALVSPIAQPIETNLSIEFVLFTEPIESQLTIGVFLNFEQCRRPMKQFCHFYLQNKVSLTATEFFSTIQFSYPNLGADHHEQSFQWNNTCKIEFIGTTIVDAQYQPFPFGIKNTE